MKSLKGFLIPSNRAIENFHYSGYVLRLQLQRQIQAKREKLALEKLQENKIPVNQTTHWFLKKMTREELIIVVLKKEIKTYKMGRYAKSTNIL